MPTLQPPLDVRAQDDDPPCTLCGQTERDHPTAREASATFHPYHRPARTDTAVAPADPAPPREAVETPPPATPEA